MMKVKKVEMEVICVREVEAFITRFDDFFINNIADFAKKNPDPALIEDGSEIVILFVTVFKKWREMLQYLPEELTKNCCLSADEEEK